MATKHEVIALHRQHPDWSSGRIAEELDCLPEYVRVTLQRNGIRARGLNINIIHERERCAAIARQHGAEHVAEAIETA